MVKWLWWKRGPNYEEELPRLADQIKQYSAKLITVRASHRRWKGITVLTLLLAYIIELCYYVLLGSSSTSVVYNNHSKLPVPSQWRYVHVVAGPVVAYLIYTTLSRALGWRERRLTAALGQLKQRHRSLINEYKKKINFDQIQKLVQEPNQELENTPHNKRQPNARRQTPAPTASKPPNASNAQATTTTGAAPDAPPQSISGTNPAAGAPISTTSYLNTHAPQNTLNGQFSNQLNQGGVLHGDIANFAPLPIYHSTWIDRVMDLILGENEQSPTQRYALICGNCHVHNGLAPFGKTADEMTYICPVCGTHNGPKNGLRLGRSNEEVTHHEQTTDQNSTDQNSTESENVQAEKESSAPQFPSIKLGTQGEPSEELKDVASAPKDSTPDTTSPTSDPSTSVSKQSHPDLRKRKV